MLFLKKKITLPLRTHQRNTISHHTSPLKKQKMVETKRPCGRKTEQSDSEQKRDGPFFTRSRPGWSEVKPVHSQPHALQAPPAWARPLGTRSLPRWPHLCTPLDTPLSPPNAPVAPPTPFSRRCPRRPGRPPTWEPAHCPGGHTTVPSCLPLPPSLPPPSPCPPPPTAPRRRGRPPTW